MARRAVVGREVGKVAFLPCVIGTGNGPRVIPDGALVEIDGSEGTVRVLGIVGSPATDRSGSA